MPDLSNTEIKIGTSGFSFQDWRGNFYPSDIDKGKMLDYYVQFFDAVEINSTYYSIPHPVVMHNLVKKVPDNFKFYVKVPQSFTHRRTELENDGIKFKEALKPLSEANMLDGLLAQFPYSFKFNNNNLEYLKVCNDYFENNKLFIEFRHDSWVNRQMYDYFKSENMHYVCVDEPQLNYLLKPDFFTTNEIGYVRLHGRNNEKWWDGGPKRYDYNYSQDELDKWLNKIIASKSKVNKLILFFNNCHGGQAIKNAIELKQMMNDRLGIG